MRTQYKEFLKEVTTQDCFIDLPKETRLLYFNLVVNSNPLGEIRNMKTILFISNCEGKQLKQLIEAGLIEYQENENYFQVVGIEE